MRRFRFTLESVRELREQRETSAKEALAREIALGLASEQKLADASRRLDEARASAVPADGPIDMTKLRAQQAFVERRELEQTVAARNAEQQAERVEAGRRHLTVVSSELEAVERLKERRRREHMLAGERAESLALEELGLATHRRNHAVHTDLSAEAT
jgi:flagellar export protein FliJ